MNKYKKKSKHNNRTVVKYPSTSPPINNTLNVNTLTSLCKVDDNVYKYINIGKNGDRNIIGQVKKTIKLKNCRNEVITIEEEHNFINGSHGHSMRMRDNNRIKKYDN